MSDRSNKTNKEMMVRKVNIQCAVSHSPDDNLAEFDVTLKIDEIDLDMGLFTLIGSESLLNYSDLITDHLETLSTALAEAILGDASSLLEEESDNASDADVSIALETERLH